MSSSELSELLRGPMVGEEEEGAKEEEQELVEPDEVPKVTEFPDKDNDEAKQGKLESGRRPVAAVL